MQVLTPCTHLDTVFAADGLENAVKRLSYKDHSLTCCGETPYALLYHVKGIRGVESVKYSVRPIFLYPVDSSCITHPFYRLILDRLAPPYALFVIQ